jgi:hypothetical protein
LPYRDKLSLIILCAFFVRRFTQEHSLDPSNIALYVQFFGDVHLSNVIFPIEASQ